jgi:crotonobetainyl-CoA:carnitine CoA-transferase CaiB-like acyl-CoA transferase
VRNRAQLTTLIGDVLCECKHGRMGGALEAAGVPCGPINTVPQVFADAQVRHRGMLVDIPHPLSGTVAQVVSPIRFSEAPLAFERAPRCSASTPRTFCASSGSRKRKALVIRSAIVIERETMPRSRI